MHFANSVEIAAQPGSIFSLYSNVSDWPSWDPEVETSSLSGPFVTGTWGKLKPKGGPSSKIELIEVSAGKSFTVQCKLPLCAMRFEHQLVQKGTLTVATHSVSFTGLLSPLFGLLIGTGIKKTLPSTLDGLKRAAEASLQSPR